MLLFALVLFQIFLLVALMVTQFVGITVTVAFLTLMLFEVFFLSSLVAFLIIAFPLLMVAIIVVAVVIIAPVPAIITIAVITILRHGDRTAGNRWQRHQRQSESGGQISGKLLMRHKPSLLFDPFRQLDDLLIAVAKKLREPSNEHPACHFVSATVSRLCP